MTNFELWRCYEISLSKFCSRLSLMSEYKKLIDKNEEFDQVGFEKAKEELGRYGNNLIKYKEILGLDGGLSFLRNANFDGFSIKDGEFVGSTDNVRLITDPWIESHTRTVDGNHYLFEVAYYVQWMAFPMKIQTEEIIERAEIADTNNCEEVSFRERGKIWNLIKSNIKSFALAVGVLEATS